MNTVLTYFKSYSLVLSLMLGVEMYTGLFLSSFFSLQMLKGYMLSCGQKFLSSILENFFMTCCLVSSIMMIALLKLWIKKISILIYFSKFMMTGLLFLSLITIMLYSWVLIFFFFYPVTEMNTRLYNISFTFFTFYCVYNLFLVVYYSLLKGIIKYIYLFKMVSVIFFMLTNFIMMYKIAYSMVQMKSMYMFWDSWHVIVYSLLNILISLWIIISLLMCNYYFMISTSYFTKFTNLIMNFNIPVFFFDVSDAVHAFCTYKKYILVSSKYGGYNTTYLFKSNWFKLYYYQNMLLFWYVPLTMIFIYVSLLTLVFNWDLKVNMSNLNKFKFSILDKVWHDGFLEVDTSESNMNDLASMLYVLTLLVFGLILFFVFLN